MRRDALSDDHSQIVRAQLERQMVHKGGVQTADEVVLDAAERERFELEAFVGAVYFKARAKDLLLRLHDGGDHPVALQRLEEGRLQLFDIAFDDVDGNLYCLYDIIFLLQFSDTTQTFVL